MANTKSFTDTAALALAAGFGALTAVGATALTSNLGLVTCWFVFVTLLDADETDES